MLTLNITSGYCLQNDISDILDLTFSIDADEEKLILYERAQVSLFAVLVLVYLSSFSNLLFLSSEFCGCR